ncbi:D-alanine--D-alanine ligase [Novimethylophilus kurashikiensis]|uniref:D-alanine--D-alanine ligase n=1 Tax=Novimethylophilus kurashikiensis TaxID=1825523 RepID=A0A2R5FF89_9PROT|nr:RimK family protein [Novimethylophilus kurashikiensis]GBG15081.1 D-alanine--D-alanine ligase [Novimethylophilus kurashikiensis]
MNTLIVIDEEDDWPRDETAYTVVEACHYLTTASYGEDPSIKVYNLCQSTRYQSLGYYVSLLAEARDHAPLPPAGTIEDVQSFSLMHVLTGELSDLIDQSLAHLEDDRFELAIYFGQHMRSEYGVLARQLFNLLEAPLANVTFTRENRHWRVAAIQLLNAREIPSEHKPFAVQAAQQLAGGRKRQHDRRLSLRHHLAILVNPNSKEPPSNEQALNKFVTAAESLGIRAEFITPGDYARLPEFDALFIRDTTFMHHYTYHFSRRATAEGLVVIDDPDSILKCNNKVYLAELLTRYSLPAPKTLMVHRDNIDDIIPTLSLPCVLKQPDSSFSIGVTKAESEHDLREKVPELLEKSDLILAQEWLPTDFDWRIGVIDQRPLFACKYFMADGHWQIVKHDEHGWSDGPTVAVPIADAPEDVVRTALQAANLIGNGFYGVDIKQSGKQLYIIEINDNPNVDAGNEDGVLHDALYREVMSVFLKRIEERKNRRSA